MNKRTYSAVMGGNSDNVERIIIQPKGNKAKAYQVKHFRNIITKYGLSMEV